MPARYVILEMFVFENYRHYVGITQGGLAFSHHTVRSHPLREARFAGTAVLCVYAVFDTSK